MLSIFAIFLSLFVHVFSFQWNGLIAEYIFGAQSFLCTRALAIQLHDIDEDVKLWDTLKDLVKDVSGKKDQKQ